jgi:hypothetical protein
MNRYIKVAITGFVAGLVGVSAALAGILVPPLPDDTLPTPPALPGLDEGQQPRSTSSRVELGPTDVGDAVESQVRAPNGKRIPDGTFLVGAARVSLEPAPTLFGGERWQTEGCTAYQEGQIDTDHAIPVNPDDPVDTVDRIRSWPAASPDCIYLGGFGVGPVRPAERVGHGGVWIRALAVSNGAETFVYEIADLVGWFARYDATICTDCGIRDVRERLAEDLGIDVGEVVAASTHSHATADTYGGWGGIPNWYRNQIRDSAVAAAKQAVANMVPATLATGEVQLRTRNNERRDHYYSTVDTGATWIQARTATGQPGVIATMATYAAHPTIVDDNILHADWPGASARAFEGAYGGVGLLFEGGLGNASVSELSGDTDAQKAEATGIAIAEDIGAGIESHAVPVGSNDMAAAVQDITHPVMTNPGLATMTTVGLFDREFLPGTKGAGLPGVYHWSKNGELSMDGDVPDPAPEALRGCTSSGPTVVTTVGAHRIGDVLIGFTPGEIFSNVAEVIKERADRNSVAMVLGQSNDALGYIIQSFEFDSAGNLVTEYGTQTGEYEEVFAIDRCLGDHVLETALESTRELGFGG